MVTRLANIKSIGREGLIIYFLLILGVLAIVLVIRIRHLAYGRRSEKNDDEGRGERKKERKKDFGCHRYLKIKKDWRNKNTGIEDEECIGYDYDQIVLFCLMSQQRKGDARDFVSSVVVGVAIVTRLLPRSPCCADSVVVLFISLVTNAPSEIIMP